MTRLPALRKALWELILAAHHRGGLEIPMEKDLYHITGTVPLATLLAKRRGIDPALATAAMLLHDAGRLLTGVNEAHQLNGLPWAEEALLAAGFGPVEVGEILQAIASHIQKGAVGTPLEELVRDADVLEVYLSGLALPPAFLGRVARLEAELGLRRTAYPV